MQSLRNLFASLANLAGSINGLAGVIDAASARLRQQLAFEEVPPALPPSEVIDGDEPAPGRRNGRTKATA